MEIFLLFLILVFVIIHYNSSKTKFEEIFRKLHHIEEKLRQNNTHDSVRTEKNATSMEPKEFAHEVAKVPEIQIEEQKPEQKPEPEPTPPIPSYLVVEEVNENTDETQEEIEEPIDMYEPITEELEDEPQVSWQERFSKNNPDLERFIGENLISKIGIAILVLGIAFFVKFAIDNNWINEAARVGIGVLAGSIVLGFAHKLRSGYQAFSSVLVSGGITVYYFTFGIAFQEYHLFSQTLAFAFIVLVTAFSVLISLSYNRQELAVLSLIGGFATPFIVSTGEGNYVVLFTYLLILDVAMLVMSFYRQWFWIKVCTYAFTILLFGAWFIQKVLGSNLDPTQIPYAGALGFATGFYLVFSWANLIGLLRNNSIVKAFDISFLLSNTFLYFTCGMLVLQSWNEDYKGLFTLAMAAYNMLLTYFTKRNEQSASVVFYSLLGLALTFITLVAPIQLSGHYITLFWAAETCLLLWLAIRSDFQVYRFGSVAVLVLAMVSMVMDWYHLYRIFEPKMMPVFNQAFLSSFAVLASVQLYIYLLKSDSKQMHEWMGEPFDNATVAKLLRVLFIPLLYLAGLLELNYHLAVIFDFDCQVSSYLYAYHFLFTTLLFYYIREEQSSYVKEYIITLGGFLNVCAFTFFVNATFFEEVGKMYPEIKHGLYTYIPNLLSLIFIIPSLPIIYRTAKNGYKKMTAWAVTILLTIFSSSELLVNVYYFTMDTMIQQQYNPMNESISILENTRSMVIKSGFPILWGVLAFVLLSLGIKRGYKTLRIAALSLIGLTILKLFIYDIRNVSEGGKIAAFILLGIVLLVISFAYQKIKAIILEEEGTDET